MIVAAAISLVGIAAILVFADADMPTASQPASESSAAVPPPVDDIPDDVMIREVVRDFLRESARGDSMSACLMVIDNGGILNLCEDHLEGRQDWKALTTLDPTLTVTGYERAGNVATVTGSQLDPVATMRLSVEIVHTEYGSWKVRTLNGSAIEWKGEYGTR